MRIRDVLRQGGADDVARADFFIVDDNLGLYRHRVETEKPELVMPDVIKSLQKLLIEYPKWEIMIAFDSFGGVVVRDDEIIVRRLVLGSAAKCLQCPAVNF